MTPRVKLSECQDIFPIEVVRDGEFQTPGFLSDPRPEMLAFCDDGRYLRAAVRRPEVRCLLVRSDSVGRVPEEVGVAVAPEPGRAFFAIHNALARRPGFYWQDFETRIDPTADVHPTASIAVRNVSIGARTQVGARAVILDRTIIGSEVVILPGAVLGSVGFQTAHFGEETVELIHGGGIRIEDGVLILANAVIASAIFRQTTLLAAGTRVGNCAFISHNVQTGPRCIIGHGAVVNGNVRIGADVWIGPGSTLTNNITVGDRAHISLGSAVITDVPAGRKVTGGVAVDHVKLLRLFSTLR